MAKAYRIRDWDKHFANAESNRIKNPQWVSLPIRHDGKGFRKIGRQKQAGDIYCGWCLLLSLAQKMPLRGTLIDDDGPLSMEDMSIKTSFDEAVFQVSIPFVMGLGWIEEIEYDPVSWLLAVDEAPYSERLRAAQPTRNRRATAAQPARNHPLSQNAPQERDAALEVGAPPTFDPSAESAKTDDVARGATIHSEPLRAAQPARNDGATGAQPTNVREGRGGEGNKENHNNIVPQSAQGEEYEDQRSEYDDDDPNVSSNDRTEILAAIALSGFAETLSPLHRDQLIKMALSVPIPRLCDAIETAASAKIPRHGAGFVTYVEKVIATKAHNDRQASRRNPTYSRDNPPPRTGDGNNKPKAPPPSFADRAKQINPQGNTPT